MTTETLSQRARNLHVDERKIADFCVRNHIRSLSLFGSVLREDFHAGSDVDVLVEFEPGCTPGLELFRMQDELSSMLRRPVDLRTPAELSKYFRDTVMAEAEPMYVHR